MARVELTQVNFDRFGLGDAANSITDYKDELDNVDLSIAYYQKEIERTQWGDDSVRTEGHGPYVGLIRVQAKPIVSITGNNEDDTLLVRLLKRFTSQFMDIQWGTETGYGLRVHGACRVGTNPGPNLAGNPEDGLLSIREIRLVTVGSAWTFDHVTTA